MIMAGAADAAPNEVRLPDQDFEGEELVWTLWPSESQSKAELDASMAHSGKQSLRVTAVRASDRAIVNTATDQFRTEVMYQISVFVRKDASVPDTAISYFINLRGGPDNAILSRAFPFKLTRSAEGDWTRWSGLFFVPENIKQRQFCLGVEYATGRVWFDDIRIEELGPVTELCPDVWSYLPMGVETGGAPLRRFIKHQEAGDIVYQNSKRYNKALVLCAEVERDLSDLERMCAYAGHPLPKDLTSRFTALDQALNSVYLAYGKAFKSGEERDADGFARQWAGLVSTSETLRKDIHVALQQLGPKQALDLPKHLGRQSRDVPPLTPTGKMNRLLFGCWSPTPFVEFEKPFDLEFHSVAPGAPKAHTETTCDFSNITEACDRLQEKGYRGTFGYLQFGIHDSMYAPKWLVDKYSDDPDFVKTSWDDAKGIGTGSRQSLNYFHPAVRAFIKEYLGKYAAFCRNEPRVLFHEVAQEAYPDFRTAKGTRQSGYGPNALRAFRAYLNGKYGTIEKLNSRWGAQYAGFDAIQPPPDGYAEPRKEITPLMAEFEAFREDGYIGYLKLIYDSLKAGDPSKAVVARHSSLLRHINGARIFDTCDVLCYHHRAPDMQMLNVYLNSLNRYQDRGLGYMEDFWGVQEDRTRYWDERVQRRNLARHVARTCTWGRTLQMKWYAYTTGSYITTYNGNWFNPRYDVTTMRYCAPALAITKRKMERFDWVLTHSRIVPSRVLLMQPSATMCNTRPQNPCYGELGAWHGILYPNGWLYELVPEEYIEDGRAKLDAFDVVVLPGATYMSNGLQDKLVAFVKGGGTLVCAGRPGTGDEIACKSGRLLDAIRQRSKAWYDAERVWDESGELTQPFVIATSGKGTVVACASAAKLAANVDRKAFIDLLARSTTRTAWSEQSHFEVVLRVTDDGERYLFVLNPNTDAAATDTVRVSAPVAHAIDLSLPSGFPVSVRQAGKGVAMRVHLAPGDCAVLHLVR